VSLKSAFYGSTLCVLVATLIGCGSGNGWDDFQGGVHLVLQVGTTGNFSEDEKNTIKIMEIIGRRLQGFGIARRIVQREDNRRIIVQLPYIENLNRVIGLITSSARLQFKLVDEHRQANDLKGGSLPENREILYLIDSGEPLVLIKDVVLSNAEIVGVETRMDSNSSAAYLNVVFNDEGARILEEVTAQNIRRRLAIILDGRIYSAPVIQEKISGGEARISGAFSVEQARDLENMLKYGEFPSPVELLQHQTLTRELWQGHTPRS
jgi:preprotein translocase subunit SecD